MIISNVFFYYKLSNLKGKLNNSYSIGIEEGWQKGDFYFKYFRFGPLC